MIPEKIAELLDIILCTGRTTTLIKTIAHIGSYAHLLRYHFVKIGVVQVPIVSCIPKIGTLFTIS